MPNGLRKLPEVCRQWESLAEPIADAGVRTVHLRFGVVLSKSGGALVKMWVPFQIGLGGILGDGKQMLSWIALNEIPLIVRHVIEHTHVQGPVNAVSPYPVNNATFTKALGKAIHRPTVFPVPAFAVRLLFGEMGQTLLLEGNHVLPKRLKDSGYVFTYPQIDSALANVVKD